MDSAVNIYTFWMDVYLGCDYYAARKTFYIDFGFLRGEYLFAIILIIFRKLSITCL